MALITVSYVITNYEHSSFAVYQSKFPDLLKPEIVAISSASTESHVSGVSRTTKIGISIGVVAFFLLTLVAVIVVGKKRKKKRKSNHRDGEGGCATDSVTEQQQQLVDEIVVNSLIGLHRGLPDSGKAGLLDTVIPSGSVKEVLEILGPSNRVAHQLVKPSAPFAYDLMARHPSDGISMTQNHEARNKYRIYIDTDMSSQSQRGISTSTKGPHVETTICSDQAQKSDLDRSLPPIPIFDSPQVSPVTVGSSGVVRTRKGFEARVETSAAVKSVYGKMDQVPPHIPANAWQRGLARLSHASVGMEVELPPGLSDAEIIKPLNVHKQHERSRRNFF